MHSNEFKTIPGDTTPLEVILSKMRMEDKEILVYGPSSKLFAEMAISESEGSSYKYYSEGDSDYATTKFRVLEKAHESSIFCGRILLASSNFTSTKKKSSPFSFTKVIQSLKGVSITEESADTSKFYKRRTIEKKKSYILEAPREVKDARKIPEVQGSPTKEDERMVLRSSSKIGLEVVHKEIGEDKKWVYVYFCGPSIEKASLSLEKYVLQLELKNIFYIDSVNLASSIKYLPLKEDSNRLWPNHLNEFLQENTKATLILHRVDDADEHLLKKFFDCVYGYKFVNVFASGGGMSPFFFQRECYLDDEEDSELFIPLKLRLRGFEKEIFQFVAKKSSVTLSTIQRKFPQYEVDHIKLVLTSLVKKNVLCEYGWTYTAYSATNAELVEEEIPPQVIKTQLSDPFTTPQKPKAPKDKREAIQKEREAIPTPPTSK